MRTEEKVDSIVVYPEGRIDSNTSVRFLEELQDAVKGHEDKSLEIDMHEVEYISSAGLRALLTMKKKGINILLTNVCAAVYDIFQTTGFSELFEIKKALRVMSVDGCEVIGTGFFGTVYRIDEDTIVKVYESPDSIPMIENEQLRAKQALLKGIPTAISFDVVKVGDCYGSVFEMLKAKTFNDLLIEDLDNADEVISKYVDFVKEVHGTVMDPDSLPYAAQIYTDYLEQIAHYLTDDQYNTLKKYLSLFPKDDHVVHGDFHLKNVMLVDNEPMLIDMDTLSAGHPIFDLAGIYVTYVEFAEDDPDNIKVFHGISSETALKIWNTLMDSYFQNRTEEEVSSIFDKIKLVAAIRFLYIIDVSDLKNSDLGKIRIEHTKQHIAELLDKVDGLMFEV